LFLTQEPVRFMPEATHFKKVYPDGPNTDFKWEACSPGDPEAVRMDLMEMEGPRLVAPAVTLKDFVKVLSTAKSSVGPQDIERHTAWTEEFGQEG
jgi:vacuolar protein-sorting-associated protein 4